MKYQGILEEELKNKIASDYFGEFDATKIMGKVDFCVVLKHSLFETQSVLWAEAKKGKSDIVKSFIQLILTIGKAKTFGKFLPPLFLGAFDSHQFAFVPYSAIQEFFHINDFNWNVTSSNHETKEFKQLHQTISSILESESLIFDFEKDDDELRKFIAENFTLSKQNIGKIQIDKNNFLSIYDKWHNLVKPTILFPWEKAKTVNIFDCDFYLADLFSKENETIKEGLFAILKETEYELDRRFDDLDMFNSRKAIFNDNQKAHKQFWNKYERPPRMEHWDYIIKRKELLLPQDVRERKGAFFTPQVWVEKSQEYLRDYLGENWQDEYYIWDCCSGTGNLLNGLVNTLNIYGSTLDQSDVDAMKDRIQNGTNLSPKNVFQFDFLNDSFFDTVGSDGEITKKSKVPLSLQKILKDPKERQKLVIYINPPYAEVSSYGKKEKKGVNKSKIHAKYTQKLGGAGRELFAQFFARIYLEIDGCILGEFSTVKALQGAGFDKFRDFFEAKLEKMFIIPAVSFDNVKGKFPISFKVWNTAKKQKFKEISSDVYDLKNKLVGQKIFRLTNKANYINRWISKYKIKEQTGIGFLAGTNGNDFQTNDIVYILNRKYQMANPRGIWIDRQNLIYASIYNAVRHCEKSTWTKNGDQFLVPNGAWATDIKFQNNCLTYTLFTNNISCKEGVNHWIPFGEAQVGADERFESRFMTDYIAGKLTTVQETIFGVENITQEFPLEFGDEAKAVFGAGLELWRYYHETPKIINFDPLKVVNYNVNASFYDIKQYFQGTNEAGRMNSKSKDEKYNQLLAKLNQTLDTLALVIEPKIYQYEFLLK